MAEPTSTQPDEAERRGHYRVKDWPSQAVGAYRGHRIITIWNEQGLLETVVAFLRSAGIDWMSVDLVRFMSDITAPWGTTLVYDS
jgi:hypothetical protein